LQLQLRSKSFTPQTIIFGKRTSITNQELSSHHLNIITIISLLFLFGSNFVLSLLVLWLAWSRHRLNDHFFSVSGLRTSSHWHLFLLQSLAPSHVFFTIVVGRLSHFFTLASHELSSNRTHIKHNSHLYHITITHCLSSTYQWIIRSCCYHCLVDFIQHKRFNSSFDPPIKSFLLLLNTNSELNIYY